MKTSNKLLIGFLIFILAVPLCFLMAMKYKVKKGEFLMANSIISGKLGDFKVIKIEGLSNMDGEGAAEILSCRIRYAPNNKYEYSRNDVNNFLEISTIKDTIFLKYNEKDIFLPTSHMIANIYLSDLRNIVVNKATVSIDSIDSRLIKTINIKLQNHAELNVGTIKENGYLSNIYITKMNKDGSYTTLPNPASTIQTFDTLNVDADSNSDITLGESYIKNLLLNMQSNSTLNIPSSFNVDNISGKIDSSASIKGNFKALNALQHLLK